jgi:hypothetical protein
MWFRRVHGKEGKPDTSWATPVFTSVLCLRWSWQVPLKLHDSSTTLHGATCHKTCKLTAVRTLILTYAYHFSAKFRPQIRTQISNVLFYASSTTPWLMIFIHVTTCYFFQPNISHSLNSLKHYHFMHASMYLIYSHIVLNNNKYAHISWTLWTLSLFTDYSTVLFVHSNWQMWWTGEMHTRF